MRAHQRIDTKTGEEIDWDDIVKGYEYADGQYVTFTHEELDQIPSDSIHSIDVVQFVPAAEIDPIAYERSYYVAPSRQVSRHIPCSRRHSREANGTDQPPKRSSPP